jgi:hypothetical protein
VNAQPQHSMWQDEIDSPWLLWMYPIVVVAVVLFYVLRARFA